MQIRRGWQPCNWHSTAAIILTGCRRQGYSSSTCTQGWEREGQYSHSTTACLLSLLSDLMGWKTLPSAQLLVLLPYFSTLPEGVIFFFLCTSIQNSSQMSAVLCLCFSPSILSLVPNSCRICTTKRLCAGAEQ